MKKIVYSDYNKFVTFEFEKLKEEDYSVVTQDFKVFKSSQSNISNYYMLTAKIFDNAEHLSYEQLVSKIKQKNRLLPIHKQIFEKISTAIFSGPVKEYSGSLILVVSKDKEYNAKLFQSLTIFCDNTRMASMAGRNLVPILKYYNNETFIVTRPQIENMEQHFQSVMANKNDSMIF